MTDTELRRSEHTEERARTLELFYDLVFVFSLTQVTHLILNDLTSAGVLHALIILLVVWWSWNNTTWATNELNRDHTQVALLMMVLMALGLVMAVAIPSAFSDRALLFAGCNVAIQLLRHGFLAFSASEPESLDRQRGLRVFTFFAISGVFWISGAIASGELRILFWIAALLIDYGAPLIHFRIPGLPDLSLDAWRVTSEHFAERFNLFVILTLGETIIITGATTSALDLGATNILAFLLAFASTAAMWWMHFRKMSESGEEQLEDTRDPVRMARNAYSYAHVLIVMGILTIALADELVISHPMSVPPLPELLPVIVGPILFLTGEVLYQYNTEFAFNRIRSGAAMACALVSPLGLLLPAMVGSGLVTAILIAVPLIEARLGRLEDTPGEE
jgi:low temperature requirement protein LtrA